MARVPEHKPRAHTKADDVYNARKRAKRMVARLENEVKGQTGSTARATREYISSLKTQIEKSYVNKSVKDRQAESKRTQQVAAALTETLNRIPVGRGQRVQVMRSNKMFERQINLASSQSPNVLTNEQTLNAKQSIKYAKSLTSIFYKATKNLWQGKDPSKRNEIIMQHYGTTSLEDAFNKVLEQQKVAVQRAYDAAKGNVSGKVENTAAQEAFNQDVSTDSEKEPSPDEVMSAVKPVSNADM